MGTYASRRVVASILAVAIAGVALSVGSAEAAVVLCQRKKKLFLRNDACKAKETAVQLVGTSVDAATLGEVPSAAQAATAASATTATTATDAGTLDGKDSTELQDRIRWALLSQDGSSILAQSGGISIVAEAITGIYVLDFGEDLRGRGVVATVRGGLTNKAWAQAAICGGSNDGGAQTSFCNTVGGSVTDMPNELAIAMVDPDGMAVDRSVYVAVFP